MSAIDWLSDSLRAPVAGAGGEVSKDARPVEVTVTALDDTAAPLAGLSDGPEGLWAGAGAGEIAAALATLPVDLPGGLGDLVTELLTARVDPPEWDTLDRTGFLVARIDALLALGRLEAAEGLANLGQPALEVMRRRFDIALLTGTEDGICEELAAAPGLSPTWPARVFCLARNGDFDAAALTYGTAETLGMLTPAEDVLLARFLDPELFAEEDLGPPPARPTPLDFRLWEAAGEPLPTADLPVAYMFAELAERNGWKTRLEAAERLAAAGAIRASRLFEIYGENKEAASGGLWDRVKAVAALDRALQDGDPERIGLALEEAWGSLRAAGLSMPFAEAYAGRVSHVPFDAEEPALIAAEMALLAPGPLQATGTGTVGAAFETAAVRMHRDDPERIQVVRAMTAPPDVPVTAPGLEALRAISDIVAGAEGDMARLADGLLALRRAGFETAARRAATAVLLGTPRA